MDWIRHLQRRSCAAGSASTPRSTRSRPSASTCSSATPGSWNFGQAGFLLVGGYGTAIAVNSGGSALGWAVLVGDGRRGAARARARHPDAAAARRLPRDRDDLGGRDPAHRRQLDTVQSVTGGPQGIGGFAELVLRPQSDPDGRYGVGTITFTQRDLWVMLVHVGARRAASAFGVPRWCTARGAGSCGRFAKTRTRCGRSARTSSRTRCRASCSAECIGGLAGIMLVIDRQFVEPNNFQSAITFFAFAALILGGTARIFGPILGAIAVLVPRRSDRELPEPGGHRTTSSASAA